MISKARMMIAARRGKPDRLPVTSRQWPDHHVEHFFETSIKNLKALAPAGKECRYAG